MSGVFDVAGRWVAAAFLTDPRSSEGESRSRCAAYARHGRHRSARVSKACALVTPAARCNTRSVASNASGETPGTRTPGHLRTNSASPLADRCASITAGPPPRRNTHLAPLTYTTH